MSAAKLGGVGFEFAQGGGEEAGGAEGVVAAEVVEGDGDLDERLGGIVFSGCGVVSHTLSQASWAAKNSPAL